MNEFFKPDEYHAATSMTEIWYTDILWYTMIYYDILWYTMIYFFVEVPYQTSIAWILTLIVYLLHFPSLIVYISGVLPLSHFYRYVCLHLHDWYVYVMCSVYIYTQENDQHIQKLTR